MTMSGDERGLAVKDLLPIGQLLLIIVAASAGVLAIRGATDVLAVNVANLTAVVDDLRKSVDKMEGAYQLQEKRIDRLEWLTQQKGAEQRP